jgi:hypothetical protein
MSLMVMKRKYDESKAAARSGFALDARVAGITNYSKGVLLKKYQCCHDTVMPLVRDGSHHHERGLIVREGCDDSSEISGDGCYTVKASGATSESERLKKKIHGKTCLADDPIYAAHNC